MSLFTTIRRQKLLSLSLLLFTLSLGILIGTLVNSGVRAERGQTAVDATPLTIPNPVQLSTAFNQLAKKVEPTVVNIRADYLARDTQSSRNRRGQNPQGEEGDPGFDFFHRFFGGPFGQAPEMPFRREGTGSGVIVDANGYILTNNHVVEKADRIKVRLTGDTMEYDAKLIGSDRETDMAVIKIEPGKKLTAAKIGNSDAVQVGDWAVAIGSPFGLEATVTAGIISAKDRAGTEQFQHFLQTDAAINPGNSGGPLLNINGELIGINTAIATQSGGYQGIGFALPINTAVKSYNQIIKTGRVTRGSIGVSLSVQPNPELLQVYGAKEGAFVQKVESGSPADKAGLREGDVIVSMNGKPIRSGDDLVNGVADAEIGSEATLGLLRDGKKRDVKVTIGDRTRVWARNPRISGEQAEESANDDSTEAKFGLFVRNLTEADREEFGFKDQGGVLVTRVDQGSFADDVGLVRNDIIMSVNRRPVNSVDDIRKAQSGLKPGDAVAFHIKRARATLGRRAGGDAEWTSLYLAGRLTAGQ
ncbi:MAG TPA: Do family serine endopeptidase [Bryobacteraceae bacterium]|nr:Do family serine endopeptidase [Bryobacteraceae bacterium]